MRQDGPATSREKVTYDVRIWATDVYKGKTTKTYRVLWRVAGERRKQPFKTAALAESFRAGLVTAARRGEAFDVASGLPISMLRAPKSEVSWYEFACAYADHKWPNVAPKHRKGIAEALVVVTPALLDADLEPSEARSVRSALLNWAFNIRRGGELQPEEVTRLLDFVARHSRPLADLSNPEVVHRVQSAISIKLNGARAAARTVTLRRTNLSAALGYAVELGYLPENPLDKVRWVAPKAARVIDRRVVANPEQARALLAAVRLVKRSGPRLVAFFAVIYYAGLRPEEAANLRKANLQIPVKGRGWLVLESSAPEEDRHWSDSNVRREERELKHRARDDTRRCPCPPVLTEILHRHIEESAVASDGRLFRGEKGELLAGQTYRRVWARARELALTPEQQSSPLAGRPYDLRHAAVSTWLNGGVEPSRVAEWAGHSVAVLLKIYAKCLDGREEAALDRLEKALGE